jgi:DNA-binding CsgD family transcriptional regulator/PAS domain-containing protein
MSEETILRLVDLIYKAAGDASRWPTVVHRLAEALNGTASTLHGHQIPSQESHFSADWNVDPRAVTEYTEYFGYRNIWRFFRPNLLQTGSVRVTQELCPKEVFVKSEYYQDYLRRYDLFHAVAVTLRRDGRDFSNLTIFRPRGALMFDEAERRLLVILAPHLVRAFELHSRIQGLENKANVLEDTLDRQTAAIVLLDSRGMVVFRNKSARSLFESQKDLRITRDEIQASNPSEHKKLTRLIRGAACTGAGVSSHPGGAVTISRNAFKRPLHVLVSPLRTDALRLGHTSPAAVLFITDPEEEPLLPEEWLQQLYGLTPAESRLALLLAAGNAPKEAAQQLQVGISTVRSQLKSIFAKTDTNRQSELVRLLLMSPAQTLRGTVKPL